MAKNSFSYFKTSPEIIQLGARMYVRFPLSLRNAEDLLYECGIDVCHEGEVLASCVTKKRDKVSALKFLKKARKRHGNPDVFVIERCPSYRAAMKVIENEDRQETGQYLNHRAENSHPSFRRKEQAKSQFRRMRNSKTSPSIHSSAHDHLDFEKRI